MIHRLGLIFSFIVTSVIQVQIVDAKDYVIPAESPKNCLKSLSTPCAVSTGDQPRMFRWKEARWELDRNIVLNTEKNNTWNVYKGMLVLDNRNPIQLHTPFADIFVGYSKVMIHVMDDRVRVMSLSGEGVKVKAKGDTDEHFLVPGFQNWYGGVVDGAAESGVASVIEFEKYAQARAKFFMNHQYGYIQELQVVAKTVKWATEMAAKMHREMVERKMASLKVKHQNKVMRKKRKIQFNKYLRKLFLQKIRYDY